MVVLTTDSHQFRATWHDYNEGTYFITICCAKHRHYFGEIKDNQMHFSQLGFMTKECLESITLHFPNIELWNSVIMPNHLHLIIHIPVGTRHVASAATKMGCLKPMSHYAPEKKDFHHNSHLSVIIGQFKSAVTRKAKELGVKFEWQQRFHDHIIKDHNAYVKIMNYIELNVERWTEDCFYN